MPIINVGNYLSLMICGSKIAINVRYRTLDFTWKTMRLDVHSTLLELNVCLIIENALILPGFKFSVFISTGEYKQENFFSHCSVC